MITKNDIKCKLFESVKISSHNDELTHIVFCFEYMEFEITIWCNGSLNIKTQYDLVDFDCSKKQFDEIIRVRKLLMEQS